MRWPLRIAAKGGVVRVRATHHERALEAEPVEAYLAAGDHAAAPGAAVRPAADHQAFPEWGALAAVPAASAAEL
jgi:hypothetical protein